MKEIESDLKNLTAMTNIQKYEQYTMGKLFNNDTIKKMDTQGSQIEELELERKNLNI
jgi:hypothetical protein